ncbi:MAG: hypothetical protein ACRDGW_05930 [Actinomycetota bacterium]
MCRALKVLCVAENGPALAALQRAAVSADWELARGATNGSDALRQLHEERPHVVVVFGPFEGFIRSAIEAYPSIRVVADRELPGASVVVGSLEDVRGAVMGRPRPGGPVR